MIDVVTEKLIRLTDVRDYLPSSHTGKKLSKAVVFRWALTGIRGTKLETLRVGGARFTSVEAVYRFVLAQNTTGTLPESIPIISAIDAAKELDRLKI